MTHDYGIELHFNATREKKIHFGLLFKPNVLVISKVGGVAISYDDMISLKEPSQLY